ncbi:MAG TPA: hypothetical protein VJT75_16410 [Thermoleophilaceae bacterium]|nr:hypothetical protein [Thermoleophilaceae bacterium]
MRRAVAVAAAALLALGAAAPSAQALDGVTVVDDVGYSVDADASTPDPNDEGDNDFKAGEGSSFSNSATAAGEGSAQATVNATFTEGANAITATFKGTATSDGAKAQAGGTMGFRLRVDKRVSFSLSNASGVAASGTPYRETTIQSFFDSGGQSTARFTANGSGSGVFEPGDYFITITFRCYKDAPAVFPQPDGPEHCSGPTDAKFTVETEPPPRAFIIDGPSGSESPPDPTFEFGVIPANPPPGHFECRIDDFGFAPCTSPKTFHTVPPGEHIFRVRYKPDGAAAGPEATQRWGSCTDLRIGAAVAKGCFTERGISRVFETTRPAWIGGIELRPRPGGKLIVRPDDHADPFDAEGAGVDWMLGSLHVPAPLDQIKPFTPTYTLAINAPGTIERAIALPVISAVSAQVKVTWAPGGKGSTIETTISMEELTKNLGKTYETLDLAGKPSVGTAGGIFTLTLANGKPFDVTLATLQLPEWASELPGSNPPVRTGFGGGKFTAVRAGTTIEWSGELTVLFPWQGRAGKNQGSLTGRLLFSDLEVAGLGFDVGGFEIPIGKTGWDLTAFTGTAKFRPTLGVDFGVTAQTGSAKLKNLFKVTGRVKGLDLAALDCRQGVNPFAFVGAASSPELEAAKLGRLTAQVTMCGYFPMNANSPTGLDFAFDTALTGTLIGDAGPFKKLYSVTGSAKGYFHGSDFNLDGSFSLDLPGLDPVGAIGVLSSEGYAFCTSSGAISIGYATDNWLEPPQDLIGCDFTPYRVQVTPPPPRSLRAAATGRARTFAVPAGGADVAVAVQGAGGAPRVRVRGPKGETFVTPQGRALRTPKATIVPVASLGRTYVFLNAPSAGTWSVTPLPGSPAITKLASARELPKPKVTAKVKRRGAKVVVDWKSRAIPGQRIELVDRADGVATTIQPLTARHSGRVTFTPKNPLEIKRTIEAIVVRNGSPRRPLVVTRYTLRAPKRPAKVRNLTARRTKAGLVMRWGKAARAKSYDVTVNAGKTVFARVSTVRRELTLRRPPKGTLKVIVNARDAFGRPGPAASRTAG